MPWLQSLWDSLKQNQKNERFVFQSIHTHSSNGRRQHHPITLLKMLFSLPRVHCYNVVFIPLTKVYWFFSLTLKTLGATWYGVMSAFRSTDIRSSCTRQFPTRRSASAVGFWIWPPCTSWPPIQIVSQFLVHSAQSHGPRTCTMDFWSARWT